MKIKPTKPSDLTKDKEVEFWEHQIDLAETKLADKSGDMRSKGSGSKGWRALINFYKGEQWRAGMGGKEKSFDRITANQAKSNIDSIRPQLYFQNPRIQIKLKNPQLAQQDYPVMTMGPQGPMPAMQQTPQGPKPIIAIKKGQPIAKINGQVVDAQKQCDLMQAIDNYTFQETKARGKIRRIINDALILPYGVAKWEWIVETSMQEEKDDKGEPTGKKVEMIDRQYAQLSRIKPWCFIWDSELDEFDIDSSNWVAEIKYLSEEDLKADKNLKHTDDLPEPEYYVGELSRSSKKSDIEDFARYKMFEIHDLKHKEFLCWIEGSKKINRKEAPSPYEMVEGSIYTCLGFNDVPDDSFPESTIDQIKSKAEAYNKILSYAVNHVGRFNRKYKAQRGAFDNDAELEKWERGEDGATIIVKDMNLGPEPITDAPIQTDAYNVGALLKREITEDIGVTAFNRGTRETGVDTAFEASLIQGGADIKIQEKRDIVRQFCCDLIRKLNQILKAHADTKFVVQVTGDEGEQWVQWSNSDIEGEFIEDVDIYSSLPFSEELEKKQAMELFSLAGADPYFNPFKVRQQVVRVFKWPEDLLYNETEFAQMMQQKQREQQQQMQQQTQQQMALDQNKKQQSQTLRPTQGAPKGQVRRGPDMAAGIKGPPRNFQ